MTKQQTAVIYARQSSGSDDFSESVEMQIANCQELAKQNNLKVVAVFSDLNVSGKTYPTGAEQIASMDMAYENWFASQTGTKKFRSGLGQALATVKGADFLLLDDVTRLYRPVAGTFLESYVNQQLGGVKIWAVKGGVIDLGSFSDGLLNSLQGRINDNQISIQRKKAKDALNKLRDSGIVLGGAKAFGLEYLGKNKVRVIPECAEVVKWIYEQIASYTPYNQIINALNDKHLHLFKGSCVRMCNFYAIARNPIYAGFQRDTQGNLIRNSQVAGQEAITFELWDSVQKIMAGKKKISVRAKKHWLPLSGLLTCGNCGGKLLAVIDRGKISYACRDGAAKHDANCAGSRVLASVDKALYCGLLEALRPLLALGLIRRKEAAWEASAKAGKAAETKAEIATLTARQKALLDLADDGLLEPSLLKERLGEVKTKLDAAKHELLLAETVAKGDARIEQLKNFVMKDAVKNLIDGEADQGEFEALLREAISEVKCYADHIIISTVYGDFRLDRYMTTNKRNFPVFEVKMQSGVRDGEEIELVYHYGSGKREQIAKLNSLTIYKD